MALVVKKKKGQSQQRLISEFKKLTFNDSGLEKVKEVAYSGHLSPSRKKHVRKVELGKEFAKIRRRNRRASGRTK